MILEDNLDRIKVLIEVRDLLEYLNNNNIQINFFNNDKENDIGLVLKYYNSFLNSDINCVDINSLEYVLSYIEEFKKYLEKIITNKPDIIIDRISVLGL